MLAWVFVLIPVLFTVVILICLDFPVVVVALVSVLIVLWAPVLVQVLIPSLIQVLFRVLNLVLILVWVRFESLFQFCFLLQFKRQLLVAMATHRAAVDKWQVTHSQQCSVSLA